MTCGVAFVKLEDNTSNLFLKMFTHQLTVFFLSLQFRYEMIGREEDTFREVRGHPEQLHLCSGHQQCNVQSSSRSLCNK